MTKGTNLSIRMDKELHDKFMYVAKYDHRSMSGQILHLVIDCVKKFEKEQGTITADDLKQAGIGEEEDAL